MQQKFDQEFREQAVKLVIEKKVSRKKVSDDLGVAKSTLAGWIHAYKKGNPIVTGESPEQKELRKLRRENETLKEERDILKKAMAIFSCPKKRGSLL